MSATDSLAILMLLAMDDDDREAVFDLAEQSGIDLPALLDE